MLRVDFRKWVNIIDYINILSEKNVMNWSRYKKCIWFMWWLMLFVSLKEFRII